LDAYAEMAPVFGVVVSCFLALVPCSLGLAATPCQDPSVAELPFWWVLLCPQSLLSACFD